MNYSRESFTSFSGDLGVVHLMADADKALNFTVGMNRPEHYALAVDGKDLLMKGQLPDGVDTLEMKGIKYGARVRVLLPKGGSLISGDSSLTVQNASEAILLVSMATNYKNGRVGKKRLFHLEKGACQCLSFPVRPGRSGPGSFRKG